MRHVIDVPGWSGAKDLQLYEKAANAGYRAIVTNDAKQLNRKPEVEAIARSGLLRLGRIIGQPGAMTFSSDTSGSNGYGSGPALNSPRRSLGPGHRDYVVSAGHAA